MHVLSIVMVDHQTANLIRISPPIFPVILKPHLLNSLTYLTAPFTKLYNHGEWLSIISKG